MKTHTIRRSTTVGGVLAIVATLFGVNSVHAGGMSGAMSKVTASPVVAVIVAPGESGQYITITTPNMEACRDSVNEISSTLGVKYALCLNPSDPQRSGRLVKSWNGFQFE